MAGKLPQRSKLEGKADELAERSPRETLVDFSIVESFGVKNLGYRNHPGFSSSSFP